VFRSFVEMDRTVLTGVIRTLLKGLSTCRYHGLIDRNCSSSRHSQQVARSLLYTVWPKKK